MRKQYDVEVDGEVTGWVDSWPNARHPMLLEYLRDGRKVALIKLKNDQRYSVAISAAGALVFTKEQP